MKPIFLEMKAFGSYREAAIDFSQLPGGIFLITGATGAGKTTIFDAITYALYGESSGGRRSGSMMRSQFAQPDQETSVLFRFSYNGKNYEIRRRPEQPHYKKDKDGSFRKLKTNLLASVSLTMPDGSEHPGNIAAINREIEKIIGLDKAQFTQIAMIAQGDFLKLLLASSDDRRKIFSRIFDTEIYRRIEQELKERCDRQQGELSRNKDHIRQALDRVPFHGDEALKVRWDAYDGERFSENDPEGLLALVREIRDSWKMSLKDLEKREKALRKAYGETDHLLQESRQVKGWFEDLDKAEKAMEDLLARSGQIQGLRDKLDAHRRAQDLQGPYAELRKIRHDEDVALKQLRSLNDWITSHGKVLAEAKAKAAEAGRLLSLQEPELVTRIEGLQSDMPRYERLAGKAKEKAALEAEAVRLKAQTEKDARDLAGQEEKAAALAASLDHDRDQIMKLAELKPEKDRLDDLAGKLVKLEKIEKTAEEQQEKLAAADGAAEAARSEAAQAGEIYEKTYAAVMKDHAHMLAMTLKPGSPCPVCGSIYHGGADLGEQTGEGPDGEDLDQARTAREAAEDRLARLRTDAERIRMNLDLVRGQYQSLLEEVLRDIPDPEDLKDLPALRHQTDRRRKALKADIEALTALRAKMPASREELTAMKTSLAALKASMERHQNEQQELRQKAAAARAAYDEAASQVTYADKAKAEEALKAAQDQLDQLKTAEKAAGDEEARCSREMADHEVRRDQTADQKAQYAAAREKAEKAFADGLRDRQLADEAAYKNALLSPGEASETEQKIREYDIALAGTRRELDRLQEVTAGKEIPDLDLITAQLEAIDQQIKALKRPIRDTSNAEKTCTDALTEAEKYYKKRAQLSETYQNLKQLSDTAGGSIPGKKLRFETYIQRRFFKSVIRCANQRLLKMNGNSFCLICRELDQARGNAYIGLDLDVEDMVSGQMRDVKSLSGGEAFLASLAMALGMADLIRMQHGRVQLETMFIDEGFGSLSDDVRGRAVEVLNELSGGKSLIGIISHVSELKSQIDTQLVVTKDAAGSHASWSGDGGENI